VAFTDLPAADANITTEELSAGRHLPHLEASDDEDSLWAAFAADVDDPQTKVNDLWGDLAGRRRLRSPYRR
jgi:hypothetical protein